MAPGWNHVWLLVIAVAALSGWWIAVRPRASYGAISTTMSFLIVLMAVLLCVLAVSGQRGAPRPAPVGHVHAGPE
jgi:hypothetical protein